MIQIQIDLNHIAQQEIPTVKKTAHNTTQMEEDGFLMECAMAQEIYIFDQEEQQYVDQIMEEQLEKQNYPEAEWDYPVELLIDQSPPHKRLLKPGSVEQWGESSIEQNQGQTPTTYNTLQPKYSG